VWDTTSRRILYKLPGHAGSVNELAFHPEEPISKSSLPWVSWGNSFRADWPADLLGNSPEIAWGPEPRVPEINLGVAECCLLLSRRQELGWVCPGVPGWARGLCLRVLPGGRPGWSGWWSLGGGPELWLGCRCLGLVQTSQGPCKKVLGYLGLDSRDSTVHWVVTGGQWSPGSSSPAWGLTTYPKAGASKESSLSSGFCPRSRGAWRVALRISAAGSFRAVWTPMR